MLVSDLGGMNSYRVVPVLLIVMAFTSQSAAAAEAIDAGSAETDETTPIGEGLDAEPREFVIYEDGTISDDPDDVALVKEIALSLEAGADATASSFGIPNACAFGSHNPHYSTSKKTGKKIVNSKATMTCTGRYPIQVAMRFQVYVDKWYSHPIVTHDAFTSTPGKKHVFYNSLACPVKGTYRNRSTGYVRWPNGQWGDVTYNSGSFSANC